MAAPSTTGRGFAARWHARLGRGMARLRTNGLLTLQVGVAACLSWFLAHDLLNHQAAFFAPIAAEVIEAVGTLAEAYGWLGRELAAGQEPEAARGRAASAMRLGYQAVASGGTLSISAGALVGQIRALAFDLMLASGLDQTQARALSQQARQFTGEAEATP